MPRKRKVSSAIHHTVKKKKVAQIVKNDGTSEIVKNDGTSEIVKNDGTSEIVKNDGTSEPIAFKYKVQYSAYDHRVKEAYFTASQKVDVMRYCMCIEDIWNSFFHLDHCMNHLLQNGYGCPEVFDAIFEARDEKEKLVLKDRFKNKTSKTEFVNELMDEEVERLWEFYNTENEGIQSGNPHKECYSCTIELYEEPKFIHIPPIEYSSSS